MAQISLKINKFYLYLRFPIILEDYSVMSALKQTGT